MRIECNLEAAGTMVTIPTIKPFIKQGGQACVVSWFATQGFHWKFDRKDRPPTMVPGKLAVSVD